MATSRRVFDVRVFLRSEGDDEGDVVTMTLQESPEPASRPTPDMVVLCAGLVTFTEAGGSSRVFPVSRIQEIVLLPYRVVDR